MKLQLALAEGYSEKVTAEVVAVIDYLDQKKKFYRSSPILLCAISHLVPSIKGQEKNEKWQRISHEANHYCPIFNQLLTGREKGDS